MSPPVMLGSVEDSVDPLIGRTIAGKFTIEKRLGAGAMGVVYRARQVALEKRVAIKVLNRALAADPTFAERFAREAKAAARLDHPNSLRVFDFGVEGDGLLYIAMEFVDGGDLLAEIEKRAPLAPARIIDILSQVLAALAVAHDMGVLHRDLKPANIMLLKRKNDDGDTIDLAKVCDFGIAKLSESSADDGPDSRRHHLTAGLVIGTPEYMSPEQARGEKVDSRSDLYTVGVILYEMLTGRTPFVGHTPLSVVLKQISEAPLAPRSIRADVDPALEVICLKAIAKDPAERFQSATDMRVVLRAALGGSAALSRNRPLSTPRARRERASAEARSGSAGGKAAAASPTAQTNRGRRRVTARPGVSWVTVAAVALVTLGVAALVARWRSAERANVEPRPSPTEERAAATAPVTTAAAPTRATAVALLAPPQAPVEVAPSARPALPVTKVTRAPPHSVAVLTELAAKAPPRPEPMVASVSSVAPPTAVEDPVPPAASVALTIPAPQPPPEPAAPVAPKFDVTSARVEVGSALHASGATALNVNRAVWAVTPPLTQCYRAALPLATGPIDGDGSIHIETDLSGFITEARVAGALSPLVAGCMAAVLRGRRIANVDTGSASADLPLVYRPR